MKLVQPTDFELLDALSDGRADIARNLQHRIDRDRPYINSRLPQLADYGLIEKIGPDSKSGLYRITSSGVAALELQDRYTDVDDFETLIEERAEAIAIQPPSVLDDAIDTAE